MQFDINIDERITIPSTLEKHREMTRLLTQFLSHLQDTHNTLQPFSVQYAYGTDHAGLKTLLQFHTMGKMGKEREKAESGRKAQKFPNFLAKLIGKCGVTFRKSSTLPRDFAKT